MYKKLDPISLKESKEGIWYWVGEGVTLYAPPQRTEERRLSSEEIEVATFVFDEAELGYKEVNREIKEYPLPQPKPSLEEQIAALKQKLAEAEEQMTNKDRENKNALFEIFSLLMGGDPV